MKVPKKIVSILFIALMPLVSSADELTGKTLGANDGEPAVSVQNVVTDQIVSPFCAFTSQTPLSTLFAAANSMPGGAIIASTAVTLQFLGFSETVVASFMASALCELELGPVAP